MRKKLISMLFLATFAGIFMVGCGSQSTPSQPTIPQPQTSTQQPTGQTGGMMNGQTNGQMNGQMNGTTQVATGDATKGKKLFETSCSSCHNPDATTKTGPGLKGIYSKSKLPNGTPVNDANLTQWMKIGNAKMHGNPALTSQDSADIEAYLKNLQ